MIVLMFKDEFKVHHECFICIEVQGDFMQTLFKIIKGAFVGMGSILPGISGSMVATILGIYQQLISALNRFTKHPIQAILSVWQYIVGVLFGFGIGFVVIEYLYERIPLPLSFLFIGLVIGAIPSIIKSLKSIKTSWHHLLTLVILMAVMIGFLFMSETTQSPDAFLYYVVIFIIGFLYSTALIIPGLSGSTLLMALGFFQILLTLGNDAIDALFTFNFTELVRQLPLILILALGIITGLIVMGKVMYHVLEKYQTHFFYGVLGIIIVSPFNILFTLQENTSDNVFQASWVVWVLTILSLVIGCYLTYYITHREPSKETNT
jgi:putative membrane protein